MALSLRLLICLLFVASVFSADTSDTSPTAPNISESEATTVEGDTEATTIDGNTEATTVDGGTGATTVDGGTGATTVDGGTGSTGESTRPPTEPPKTTAFPGPCGSNPCGGGSTCEERAGNTYVCLCLGGDYYDFKNQLCYRAKVFPGELTYTKAYDPKMADKKSEEFKETADDIVAKLAEVYKEDVDDYLNSIVTKLSPRPSTKTKAVGLIATVEIMFFITSPIKSEQVKEDIQGVEGVESFAAKTICEISNPCDLETMTCTGTDGGFNCECLAEYVKTDFSDRVCVACPNGQKAVNGECKKCDFGYSGSNCKENYQLILVIVGCVLGALLLVTIILLPVVAMTSKKKSKKAKANDYEKPYPAKTPQVSNGLAAPRPTSVKATPAGGLSGFGGNAVPRIPRATTNDSWDRNTNLEMVPSNSRQNLIPAGRNNRRFDDDDEDTNPYSRPVKPQNNPYGIGRPQVNPYASSQGQSNPYYRH